MSADEQDFYEQRLKALLGVAGVRVAAFYSLAEVQTLLGVSLPTLRRMCDLWEPPHIKGRRRDTLECYVIAGARRIPHHALVELLSMTNTYAGVEDVEHECNAA